MKAPTSAVLILWDGTNVMTHEVLETGFTYSKRWGVSGLVSLPCIGVMFAVLWCVYPVRRFGGATGDSYV
jgi:hypothetical protein